MARKTNLDFCTFANAFHYYNFQRMKVGGVYGCMYWLCKPLTDEEKADLMKWRNVRLFTSRAEYAPELKASVIFIGDKGFKEVKTA